MPSNYVIDLTFTPAGVDFIVMRRDGIGALKFIGQGGRPTALEALARAGQDVAGDRIREANAKPEVDRG